MKLKLPFVHDAKVVENPPTTIKYSIPEASFVTLKVYDILGKEITTLVNERKTAGNYSINFNASNLPSDIYFYRMQTGSFISTKKFVLFEVIEL